MRGRHDRDELLGRIDLRALLEELTGPATALGRTARWRCPVPEHDDVHPSVTVHLDRRGVERWRCWSGGHGGTAIDAIQVVYRVGYRDAIDELAQRTGPQSNEPTPRRNPPRPRPPDPVPLHPDAIRYIETCERILWMDAGRPVLDYLTGERGLDPEILRTNRVGADPGASKLRRPTGLPKWGPGAVFPAQTNDGRVTYFQTRYLDSEESSAKYGNPASRLGDNPRHGWTQPVPTPKQPVVICEGFPDAYTANGAGYTAVAVLGALNATPALAEHLAPAIGDRPVVLAFDGDEPGRSATQRLRAAFGSLDITVIEIPLPTGTDLNSWVLAARAVPDVGPRTRPTPTKPAPMDVPSPLVPGP